MYRLLLSLGMIFVWGLMLSPTFFDGFTSHKSDPSNTKRSNQIIKVLIRKDSECRKVIKDPQVFSQGWDSLPQPRFWAEILTLDPDYSLVNSAESREVLGIISSKYYASLSPSGQKYFKDSICSAQGLPNRNQILVTGGKKDYYLIKETIPNISRAIDIFTNEGVDPWYAQAILMIESPGKNRTSEVGASGAFQLMPDVAREFGMIVNDQIDERTNFRKSAQTAARLLNKIYIAKTREILNRQGIVYSEGELWFRLLVLHSYHAGPGNVSGIVSHLRARNGGVDLLRKMWVTSHGGFGNASQNYSQIALAAMIELDRIIAREGKDVCEVEEVRF